MIYKYYLCGCLIHKRNGNRYVHIFSRFTLLKRILEKSPFHKSKPIVFILDTHVLQRRHTCVQTFHQDSRQSTRKITFNKGCWDSWRYMCMYVCEENKIGTVLDLIFKANAKWIRELNVRTNLEDSGENTA